MRVLTTDEIDRELESRTKEVAAMSATLIELENHPGLEHVRLYPPTGVTAQRWTVIEKSLAQLWEDLGRMTSILDSARTVRARRSKPDDDDRTELTKLLRERPLEVSRQRIPLAQRQIGGLGEAVEYVGLADTAERMRAAYPAVVEFLDAVDRINSLVAEQLAPTQKRLDEAGTAGPKEIAELLQISATDPLSLTDTGYREAHHRHRGQRRAAIGRTRRTRCNTVELARRPGDDGPAPGRVAGRERACDADSHARRTESAGGPVSGARATPNRTCAPSYGRSPHRIQRHCWRLRRRIEAALRAAREEEQLAQGLLDRRSELKGRLTAYQAKAARLGLGEDRDLLACSRIAAGLLSRRPCDLRAVTRAVTDYQQLIVDKRGKTE